MQRLRLYYGFSAYCIALAVQVGVAGRGIQMNHMSSGRVKLASGLAGTAAVLAGASANAEIVSGTIQTNGSQPGLYQIPPAENYPLDLDGNGITDFTVASSYVKSKPGAPTDKTKYYMYVGDSVDANADDAIAQTPAVEGEPIGPANVYNQDGATSGFYSGVESTSPYFALRFGATAPYNYGWLQLREGTAPGVWDLVAYGIETDPDTAITAGAVPEPAGLGALALGAVALLRRRGSRA